MNVTNEVLAKYADGQFEIYNPGSRTRIRGEIKSAVITKNVLFVQFTWVAELDTHAQWHLIVSKKDHSIPLPEARISDIGLGRLSYYNYSTLENGVFYLSSHEDNLRFEEVQYLP